MYEDEEYGFCPECGALMKNGVCISCGYDRNKKDAKAEGAAETEAPDGNAVEQAAVPPCGTGGEASVPPYGYAAGQAPVPPYGSRFTGSCASCGRKYSGRPAQGCLPAVRRIFRPMEMCQEARQARCTRAAQGGQDNTRYGSSQQYGPQQYGPQQSGYYGQIPPGGVASIWPAA